MTTTLTQIQPVKGVPDGASSKDPAVREAWLNQRRGGITATEIRDYGNSSSRRKIIDGKVNGTDEDIYAIPVRGTDYTLGDYADHGKVREPVIAAWVQGRFGIEPCEHVYAHGENPRHLASPDGISLDPFTGELIVGTEDAVLAEIKTAKHDLTPGTLDADRVLIQIESGSQFDKKNYYTQMQWQMYVMNAARTLFVWEQHDDIVDPETGTFTPLGPPQWAWIPRNQGIIDVLVEKVAAKALAEIDAARVALKVTDLPPASEFPSEDAVLVQQVLQGRDAEATAKASKEAAWKALQGKYLGGDDTSVDLGFAQFTVSTSTPAATHGTRAVTDWEAMRRKAPALMAKYEALLERHTAEVPYVDEGTPTQKMTITAKKAKS